MTSEWHRRGRCSSLLLGFTRIAQVGGRFSLCSLFCIGFTYKCIYVIIFICFFLLFLLAIYIPFFLLFNFLFFIFVTFHSSMFHFFLSSLSFTLSSFLLWKPLSRLLCNDSMKPLGHTSIHFDDTEILRVFTSHNNVIDRERLLLGSPYLGP